MKLHPDLLRWARAHHQLVTRDAWMAAGHPRRSFDRAAACGSLVRLHRNVAALPGATIDTTTRIVAAVLSCPGTVMASHRSGAFVWDAPVDGDDPVELTTEGRSPTARAGIVVHRPVDLADLRPVVRRGIPVTNPCGRWSISARRPPTACRPPWRHCSWPASRRHGQCEQPWTGTDARVVTEWSRCGTRSTS